MNDALQWWLYLSNEERTVFRTSLNGNNSDLSHEQILYLYNLNKKDDKN